TYRITNTGAEDVTVTSIGDDKFGDLLDEAEAAWVAAGNTAPIVIPATEPDSYFEFTYTTTLSSDSLADHVNRVDVIAVDDDGTTATDYDTETVTFDDVAPMIDVTKTASSASLPETGGSVTFTYRITNTGVEDVTVTSIGDDKFGDLLDEAEAAWVAADTSALKVVANTEPGRLFENTYTTTLTSGSLTDHLNRADAIAVDADLTTATD